jgi:uncharacterized membrane protein
MALDITVSKRIRAPRAKVAAYVTDNRNDPEWIGGITESELLGSGPLGFGSDVRRKASFLGRKIVYVNRVVDLDPERRLAMRSVQAPFPMAVSYSFEDTDGADAGTTISVRVEGQPEGMYKVAGPLLARQVRRSVANDLRMLKKLMERPS